MAVDQEERNPTKKHYEDEFDKITQQPDMQELDERADAAAQEEKPEAYNQDSLFDASSFDKETGSSETKSEEQKSLEASTGIDDDDDNVNYNSEGKKKSTKLVETFITKRNVLGVVAGGSIIGLIIAGFTAILPLKIVHLSENLQTKFLASSTQAIEKRSDKLFARYIARNILPAMGQGKCGTTRDRNCVFTARSDNTIAGRVYRAWSDGRLENKLAEKYGLEFQYKANSGTSARYSMLLNGAEVMPDFTTGTFENLFEKDFLGRKESRAAFHDAMSKETKWNKMLIRFKYGRLLERKYGIVRCLLGCDKRDDFADWKDRKKGLLKAFVVARVVEPNSEKAAIFINCLTSGGCDQLETTTTGREGERRYQYEVQMEDMLQRYSQKFGKEALQELIDKADAFSKKGFTRFVVELVLERLANQASAQAVGKAIPIIGWIDLGVRVYNGITNAPKLFKIAKYSTYASSSIAHYMMYRTASDEIKSSKDGFTTVDADSVGSLVNGLGEVESDQGSGKSPLLNEVLGSNPASTTSFLGQTAYAATVMECDDKKSVKSGELICPEESFAFKNRGGDLIDAFSDSPFGQIIGAIAGGWSKTISEIIDVLAIFGNFLTDLLLKLPGVSQIYDNLSQFIEFLVKIIFGWIIGGVDPLKSGARAGQVLVSGAAASAAESANNGLGAMKLDKVSYKKIIGSAAEDQRYAFENKSLTERFFDTEDGDSFTAKFAMAMPSSPEGLADSFGSYAMNPFSAISQFAGASLSQPTHASSYSDGTWNAYKALGITPIGVPLDDPSIGQDPDKLTPEYCAAQEKIWQENVAEDEDTAYRYHTTVNPCRFEETVVGSFGGLFSNEALGKDAPGSSDSSTPPADPDATPPGEVTSDSSSTPCAANTEDLGIRDDAYTNGERIKIRLCAINSIPGSSVESTGGVPGANGRALVSSVASSSWQSLGEAAKYAGVSLSAGSSWRTMKHQVELCNDNPGCKSGTSYSAVAKPGTSNHQAGTAIDISQIYQAIPSVGGSRAASGRTCSNPQTTSQATYVWMAANARRFGVKNYANEAWHWGTSEAC